MTEKKLYREYGSDEEIWAEEWHGDSVVPGLIRKGENITVNGIDTGHIATTDYVLLQDEGRVYLNEIESGDFVIYSDDNMIIDVAHPSSFREDYREVDPPVPNRHREVLVEMIEDNEEDAKSILKSAQDNLVTALATTDDQRDTYIAMAINRLGHLQRTRSILQQLRGALIRGDRA